MTERSPGTWRLRVFTGYNAAGRPQQISRTVKGTKRQAQTQMARFVAEVDEQRAPMSGAMTFGEFLTERWLPFVAENREPTTHEAHVSKIRNHVGPTLGNVRLDKLTASHIDRAVSQWRRTLQEGSVVTTIATVSAALEQAYRWRFIPTNPAKQATRPRVRRRQQTVPTLAEVSKLIDAAQDYDPALVAATTLAAVTGLRRGELCGLCWRDVDDERLTLTVERAVKRVTGQSIEGEPKTHRARRISLDDATVEMLREYRCWRSQVGLGYPHDYLFTWRKAPTNPDALTMRFDRLAAKVGVKCRLHDLRHCVATHMLAEGVDVATVARRLGHATPRVTLQIYSHAVEEKDREAASLMSKLLAR